ncbi:MAG TPA: hypothetical protein VH459_05560 [Gaiellales bacterium]
MKEHVAPVVESLGPVATDVPDPPPAPPTPRRILLSAAYHLVLGAGFFATSTLSAWDKHGLSARSLVSTVIAGGLAAIGLSRLRALRRVRAATAR